VDNFVDRLCLSPWRPYKSRACLACLLKEQKNKAYINQPLSFVSALAMVARLVPAGMRRRSKNFVHKWGLSSPFFWMFCVMGLPAGGLQATML